MLDRFTPRDFASARALVLAVVERADHLNAVSDADKETRMRGQGKSVDLDSSSSIGPLRVQQSVPADVRLSLEGRLATGATRDLRRRGAVAFGQALRTVRAGQGLTQEQLALRCQFDRTYLSLLEGGRRNPTFTMIVKLGHALNVDPMQLFACALENYLAE